MYKNRRDEMIMKSIAEGKTDLEIRREHQTPLKYVKELRIKLRNLRNGIQ